VKFEKIIETCIYTSNLQKLKDFYVNCLGLELVSEEKQRSIFLKVGKSMLLIFNPEKTLMTNYDKEDDRGGGGGGERSDRELFPPHGAITPPSIVHFALEIDKSEYDNTKKVLIENNIEIEKEMIWNKEEVEGKGTTKSLYFRDPSGNLVEIITNNHLWPVDN
jgi:catechol 2,3-dioxygenase-like lactoylglutathione lyase family enzyme